MLTTNTSGKPQPVRHTSKKFSSIQCDSGNYVALSVNKITALKIMSIYKIKIKQNALRHIKCSVQQCLFQNSTLYFQFVVKSLNQTTVNDVFKVPVAKRLRKDTAL